VHDAAEDLDQKLREQAHVPKWHVHKLAMVLEVIPKAELDCDALVQVKNGHQQ
jgi:hypothetical protein